VRTHGFNGVSPKVWALCLNLKCTGILSVERIWASLSGDAIYRFELGILLAACSKDLILKLIPHAEVCFPVIHHLILKVESASQIYNRVFSI
jgi:hypothetical protein